MILLSDKLRANLLFSKFKPPLVLVSIDNVWFIFSPVKPVVLIPLPAVIDDTKLPVVWSPKIIKLFKLVLPVPPKLTGIIPDVIFCPSIDK